MKGLCGNQRWPVTALFPTRNMSAIGRVVQRYLAASIKCSECQAPQAFVQVDGVPFCHREILPPGKITALMRLRDPKSGRVYAVGSKVPADHVDELIPIY